MMSRYRKVQVRVWADEKFRRLSPAKPNAQTLWLYLLTTPYATSLPGLIGIGEGSLAESLGWRIKSLRNCCDELQKLGMIEVDWSARLIWLPNALRHNWPDNPNVVRGWRNHLDELPDCDLKRKALAAMEKELSGHPALLAAYREVTKNGSGNGSPNGSPNCLAKQEQEQEQYHEEEHDTHPQTPSSGAGVCVSYSISLQEPKGTASEPEGFSTFWESYPRKADRQKALTEWKNLNPSPELRQAIMNALARQKRSDQWRREVVPNPANWLKGRRWDDELPGDQCGRWAGPEVDYSAAGRNKALSPPEDASAEAGSIF
jgi:hypothetical protein